MASRQIQIGHKQPLAQERETGSGDDPARAFQRTAQPHRWPGTAFAQSAITQLWLAGRNLASYLVAPVVPEAVTDFIAPVKRPRLADFTDDQLTAFTHATTGLTCCMVGSTRSESDNVVFSPASAGTLVALVGSGAVGPSRELAAASLGLTVAEQLPRYSQWLVASCQTGGWWGQSTLVTKDSVLVAQGYTLNPAFKARVVSAGGTVVENVDTGCLAAAQRAAEQVNSAVAAATGGMIDHCLQGYDLVQARPPLVLASALYFKGHWQVCFDLRPTFIFYCADGQALTGAVMMGVSTTAIRYGERDGWQIAAVPYKDCFELLVMLPPKGCRPRELFEPGRLDSLTTAVESQTLPVTLVMPKFKVETSSLIKASLPPEAQGLFSPGADLSAMITPDISHSDWARQIHQRTLLVVDEQGSEGAAVSSTVPKCLERPACMTVDRPFAFILRNRDTGMQVFAGEIHDPRW